MPRRGLDARQVADEAARIADRDGVDAVSLVRVAAALGVRAPSLYNHVAGHAELLRLLALRALDQLSDALRDVAVGRSGEDALRAIADAYRRYVREHPGCYATIAVPAPTDPELQRAAARIVDLLVAALGAWGVEGDAAVHQVRVIRSALHGFVTIESGGGFGLGLDLDESFSLLVETLAAGLAPRQSADGGDAPIASATKAPIAAVNSRRLRSQA